MLSGITRKAAVTAMVTVTKAHMMQMQHQPLQYNRLKIDGNFCLLQGILPHMSRLGIPCLLQIYPIGSFILLSTYHLPLHGGLM